MAADREGFRPSTRSSRRRSARREVRIASRRASPSTSPAGPATPPFRGSQAPANGHRRGRRRPCSRPPAQVGAVRWCARTSRPPARRAGRRGHVPLRCLEPRARDRRPPARVSPTSAHPPARAVFPVRSEYEVMLQWLSTKRDTLFRVGRTRSRINAFDPRSASHVQSASWFVGRGALPKVLGVRAERLSCGEGGTSAGCCARPASGELVTVLGD